ncbi:hypothetical protein Scep_021142 [Stephania cephalantha]|uniref:Uncharacterized protein n=1 Tax=Stephania cephalantha TaxID=152367 RepID=A0AAP0F7Z9_9MAGN
MLAEIIGLRIRLFGFYLFMSIGIHFASLEVVNRISKSDKSKVRCGTDQRPPKTTNLRFVAEQINDHIRRQETDFDVAESEQRNCRTTDIRVDGVDDGQIAKAT